MLSKWSPFALSFVVDSVLFINLCAWFFRCGCRSLWAGAETACNIHMANMKHCPFCAHGWQGQALVMAAIVIPQALLAVRPPWGWAARLLASLALFPAMEGACALVFGWVDGYWNL